MGATIPNCILCQEAETENNPVLVIHSRGKRDGQSICWRCIKNFFYEKYERRPVAT